SPDPHAVNDAVAAASAKAGPIGACFRCSSRRNRRRLTAGLSQELFFGSLRPPPMEIVLEIATKTTRPDENPHAARQHDGCNHSGAPKPIRETARDHGPRDEGQA